MIWVKPKLMTRVTDNVSICRLPGNADVKNAANSILGSVYFRAKEPSVPLAKLYVG